MWVRGLKPIPEFDNNGFEGSHPMWVRGLKQKTKDETKHGLRRTPCGCVD